MALAARGESIEKYAMEGRGLLRRSYTQVDFPVTPAKQRHYQSKGNQQANNNYFKKFANSKMKPAMELYRPPSQRDHMLSADGGQGKPSLNVHAKEFVMKSGSPLQSSKSTGSILRDEKKSGQKSGSTNYLFGTKTGLQTQRGVQFAEEPERSRDLKRSKSMSHAHGQYVQSTNVSSELALFDKHPSSTLMKKACFNPDDVSSWELMDLAKVILNKAMDDRAHAQSYAAICLVIVEKETDGTFLEALLNNAQFIVEKKCYKEGTHRYHAFMAFLNELYSLIKPKQVHMKHHAGGSPTLTVLSLIVLVCQSVLSQKVLTQRTEVECLFFTVTTVGRDIEMEEPKLLDALMSSVRDAFLSPNTSPPIKKTLLQLIELRSSKWHLPAPAIMYYKQT